MKTQSLWSWCLVTSFALSGVLGTSAQAGPRHIHDRLDRIAQLASTVRQSLQVRGELDRNAVALADQYLAQAESQLGAAAQTLLASSNSNGEFVATQWAYLNDRLYNVFIRNNQAFIRMYDALSGSPIGGEMYLNGSIGSDLVILAYNGRLVVTGIAPMNTPQAQQIWYSEVDAFTGMAKGWKYQGGMARKLIRYFYTSYQPATLEVVGVDGLNYRQISGGRWERF